MKNKQINKTLKGKSGKDLVNLLDGKIKQSGDLNSIVPNREIQSKYSSNGSGNKSVKKKNEMTSD